MIDPPRGAAPEPEPEPELGPEADLEDGSGEMDDAGETEVETSGARRRLRAAVALTLVVAIVIFGALGGARLSRMAADDKPAVSARPIRLAAIDANGELATTDAAGGSVVPWSVPGVTFEFPAWSPDGTRVAAVGQGGDGFGVYIFAAPATPASATTAPEPVVVYRSSDHPAFYLFWSLDGQQLTFLTTEPDGIALRVAAADGSGDATIVRQGAPLYWDWADNGRLLAHIGGSEPDAFVGELGLDGRSDDAPLIARGSSHSSGPFRSPVVSRDERYRAFVEVGADTVEQIVVEARDGSVSHAVTVSGATALGFDPRGTSLAYVAPEESAPAPAALPIGPLRLIDAASGSSRTLLGGSIVAFFWAPDGKTIAALGVAGSGGGVEAATSRVVAALAGLARPRTWSPDAIETAGGIGLRVTFVEVATAAVRAQRDIRVSDTFVNQLLPFFDQYALSHRFWSADSASLALPLVAANGGDRLVVIPADGSQPNPIPDRVIGFWSP